MADTVADVLLARLREWDVEQVFGYPGDGINGLLAAWGRAGNSPQFVQARHEEMAAFEAVGYAKFSGQVGGLRGDQRAGRGAPAQRPLRRQARPRSGGGDRRPDRALGDGRLLPAGDRPAQPVQGRLLGLRPDVHGAAAAAQPDRPGDPDRAHRAGADLPDLPVRRAGTALRGAGARLQAGALQPRHDLGDAAGRRGRRPAGGRDPQRRQQGRAAGRPGRPRLRRRTRPRWPTCSARGWPRPCSARTCCPTTCPG